MFVARGLARVTRVVESLAVGTRSRDELRGDIARSWDTFRQDREEILRGLFDWEHQVLDEALRPGDRILVIGCGTGRELIALAARGHSAVGVDPSARAAAAARSVVARMGLHADVLTGFFEDVELPGRFDAVLFTHRSYGLIPGSSFRIDALRKAAGLLNEEGRVIVSYLSGPGMHPVLVAAARVGAVLGRSDLRIEPGDEVHRTSEGVFLFEHQFRAGEFAAEARRADLNLHGTWDGPCPSAVLVARRTGRQSQGPAEVSWNLTASGQSKAPAG